MAEVFEHGFPEGLSFPTAGEARLHPNTHIEDARIRAQSRYAGCRVHAEESDQVAAAIGDRPVQVELAHDVSR